MVLCISNTSFQLSSTKHTNIFICRDLPRRPLGRLLSEVYEPALAGDIHSSQQYREYIFHFLDIEIYLDVSAMSLFINLYSKC